MTSRQLSPYRCARALPGERGVVLILAILAVVLLAMLAVGIAAAVRVELRASRAGLQRLQALYLAEAGLARARALLLYDDPTLDTLYDPWGPGAEHPLYLPRALGEGFCEVRIHDASGRIDVNAAGPDVLARITGDPDLAAQIVEARSPLPMRGLPAAVGLELDPLSVIHLRFGPYQTLGELLRVPGVTPDMFFGSRLQPGLVDLLTVEAVSPNMDLSGQIRLGLNEFRNWGEPAFRKAVMARLGLALSEYEANEIFNGFIALSTPQPGQPSPGPGYTSLAQLATVAGLSFDKIIQVIDFLTVEPGIAVRGRVNINTASPQVIAALPGASLELGLAIAARRALQPFTTLGDFTAFLLAEPGGPDLFPLLIDRVDVKSSSFIIESMGYPAGGRVFRTLRAFVRRSRDQLVLVQQAEQDWPLPPIEETYLETAKAALVGPGTGAFAAAHPASGAAPLSGPHQRRADARTAVLADLLRRRMLALPQLPG